MKLIWYISIFFIIFLILLHNPQKISTGIFSSDTQLITPTRSTQQGLQLLIAVNILIFFVLTIFLVTNYNLYY